MGLSSWCVRWTHRPHQASPTVYTYVFKAKPRVQQISINLLIENVAVVTGSEWP